MPGVTAAMSSSGFLLAAVSLWPQQQEKPVPSEIPIENWAMDPAGQRVAIAAADHFIYIAWLEGDRPTRTLPYPGQLYEFDFSPDGSRLVTSSADGKARVFDLDHGTMAASFDTHTTGATSTSYEGWARWSSDGKRILTWGGNKDAMLWDVAKQTGIRIGGHDSGVVERATWNSDSTLIATASDRHDLRLWDGATGEPRSASIAIPSVEIYQIAFHPDGQRIAVGCGDVRARIVDMKSGRVELTVSHEDIASFGDLAVGGVEFSRDGAHLLTTTFTLHEVRSWNTKTGREEWRSGFDGGSEASITAKFSRDGREVFIDRNARWLDAKTGTSERQLSDSRLVFCSLSTDERWVSSLENGELVVRGAKSLEERYRVSRGPGPDATVRRISAKR